MTTLTERHLIWAGRRARRSTSWTGYRSVQDRPEVSSTLSAPAVFRNLQALPDSTDNVTGLPTRFAFWSITGATGIEFSRTIRAVNKGSSFTWTDRKGPNLTIIDNRSNITATAWYILDDANSEGIDIDAFDVGRGEFADPHYDFVTIEPDPDGKASKDANETGHVSTETEKHIIAFDTFPFAGSFRSWEVQYKIGAISTNPTNWRDLMPAVNFAGIAFAFYASVFGVPPIEPNVPARELFRPADDPRLYPFKAGLALADLASELVPKIRRTVLEAAAVQITTAAEEIKRHIRAAVLSSEKKQGKRSRRKSR